MVNTVFLHNELMWISHPLVTCNNDKQKYSKSKRDEDMIKKKCERTN